MRRLSSGTNARTLRVYLQSFVHHFFLGLFLFSCSLCFFLFLFYFVLCSLWCLFFHVFHLHVFLFCCCFFGWENRPRALGLFVYLSPVLRANASFLLHAIPTTEPMNMLKWGKCCAFRTMGEQLASRQWCARDGPEGDEGREHSLWKKVHVARLPQHTVQMVGLSFVVRDFVFGHVFVSVERLPWRCTCVNLTSPCVQKKSCCSLPPSASLSPLPFSPGFPMSKQLFGFDGF